MTDFCFSATRGSSTAYRHRVHSHRFLRLTNFVGLCPCSPRAAESTYHTGISQSTSRPAKKCAPNRKNVPCDVSAVCEHYHGGVVLSSKKQANVRPERAEQLSVPSVRQTSLEKTSDGAPGHEEQKRQMHEILIFVGCCR